MHESKRARCSAVTEATRASAIQRAATELYTDFHGRGPRRTDTILVPSIDPYADHPEIAKLGDLFLLIVGEHIEKVKPQPTGRYYETQSSNPDAWAFQIGLKNWEHGKAPDVAAPPDGKQLYFVGGDQNLDEYLEQLGCDPSKDSCDLGYCYLVVYTTAKKFDKYETMDYYHHLGEESGIPPRLIYNRAAKLFQLVGGEYEVKDVGIVN